MKTSFWDRQVPEWLLCLLALVGAVLFIFLLFVVYCFVEA